MATFPPQTALNYVNRLNKVMGISQKNRMIKDEALLLRDDDEVLGRGLAFASGRMCISFCVTRQNNE